MAAALLRDHAPHLEVRSAGLKAVEGVPASTDAVHALSCLKLDLSEHQATALKAEDLGWADLVLTMTRAHREFLLGHFSEAWDKTAVLKAYPDWETREPPDDPDLDVNDPFGREREVYQDCAAEIDRALKGIF